MNIKNIDISNFTENRFTFSKYHKCKTDVGLLDAQIRYIVCGDCVMSINKEKISFHKGEVMYIPKNVPYEIVWTSDDKIDFFVLEFNNNAFGDSYKTAQAVTGKDLYNDFTELDETEKENNKFKSFELFFRILNKIAPLLKEEKSTKNSLIDGAIRFIEENYTENFDIKSLAIKCYLSESHFYFLFKKKTGYSPIDYKNLLKVNHANVLLKENYTLDEICEQLNFSSPSFFRRIYKKFTGKTPSQIKKEK